MIHECLYKQAAVFFLLFFVVLASGGAVSEKWLWLAVLIFVNYLMIVACSLAASFIVCLFFDFTMLVQIGMLFLLFISGIFWDPRSVPDPQMTQLILIANPIAFVIDAYRQILLFDNAPDLQHLLLIGLGAALLTWAMLWLMKRHSKFLALKVLTA
ncbi:MAG: ABC transporter permease [Pseudomonadota bacterium]